MEAQYLFLTGKEKFIMTAETLPNLDLTSLRILLRRDIYANEEDMQLLIEYLGQSFDYANVAFDKDELRIDIKIKKTTMKKAEDYSHQVLYYYPLICTSIAAFLDDERISRKLSKYGPSVYSMIRSNILSLFTATALLDNNVVIVL